MNPSFENLMVDSKGTHVYKGDSVLTKYNGECKIVRRLEDDNGMGALVEARNVRGNRVDFRLGLSGAVLMRAKSENR